MECGFSPARQRVLSYSVGKAIEIITGECKEKAQFVWDEAISCVSHTARGPRPGWESRPGVAVRSQSHTTTCYSVSSAAPDVI